LKRLKEVFSEVSKMNRINQKLTSTVALALTVGASTLAAPQPADAQIVELAAGALNAIFNRPPKPIPNQSYAFGTSNFNGNNFNFCLFPCTPGAGQPSIPQAVRPTGMIPPQASVSRSMVTNRVGTIPPGAVPRTLPPQVVQPRPPRPTVIIPPIKLPINLPL
jgi:hypothetical protein